MPFHLPANLKFGPFAVTASQAFHVSPSRLSYALVNLKPLLPGHVLVCPVRVVPRLSQLTVPETTDLFLTVRTVSRTLERIYKAESFNVAVQDGVEAGQSVPHVHVHVIPRQRGDMDASGGGDRLYEMMDGEEGNIGREMWEAFRAMQESRGGKAKAGEVARTGPDGDAARVQRSEEQMMHEAEWLRTEMVRDGTADEHHESANGPKTTSDTES